MPACFAGPRFFLTSGGGRPTLRGMNSMPRRQFLKHSLKASAGVAALSGVGGRQVLGANEKPQVALIGCGGRGDYDARGIVAAGARLTWLCDVAPDRCEKTARFLERFAPDTKASAIRRTTHWERVLEDPSVDAIIVATPDHWHALPTVAGALAGKDVYVEKPHSLDIRESEVMMQAAERTGRIIQVGTQNRSGAYNHKALEYLRSGKLGPIHLVKVYNLKNGKPYHLGNPGTPPAGFDWDAWLGPAPKRPFYQSIPFGHGWLRFWDFSSGELGGDGIHQLDLALMLLGDPGLPRSVSAAGGKLAHPDDDSEMPDLLVTSFEFDGLVLTFEHSNYPKYMTKTTTTIRKNDKFPFWLHNSTRIEIYGAEQMMVVGRHGGGWQATIYPWEVVAQEYGRPCDDEHYADFLECVKTRKRPNADVRTLHPAVCMVHMANIAHRVGNRKLWFDAKTQRFDEPKANELLSYRYRAPYALPKVG